MKKIISWLFCILLFFTPLILWPTTSEVFEFNKMVFVYIMTTLIVAVWMSRCLFAKKFLFRRTLLDISLLMFLVSQIISTILSIDKTASLFGYYSRFNGGLLSTICYSLLYWAYVSNLDRKQALCSMRHVLCSATIVAIYGILEHFGIDKNIWVQDVQSRVFSTLGQPNWLAAWIVALIPLTWVSTINSKSQNPNSKQILNIKYKIQNLVPYLLSVLFFVVLLFTGSRSGLLGLVVADAIFWGYVLFKYKKQFLKQFVICNLSFVILSIAIGTQFTPSISSLLNHSTIQLLNQSQGPALETGGTESGTIRKIVWKGAMEVWKHNPIFGTGVETFAYSYYLYRPVEHNNTSEWDFIYNKAHNEYLNFLANTGAVGLLSYLFLIGTSIYQIVKSTKSQKSNHKQILNHNFENLDLFGTWNLKFGILAGYTSLLVTNFFGFSVVPTQLLFFLFPAMASSLAFTEHSTEHIEHRGKIDDTQKVMIAFVLCTMFYVLCTIANYWHADYLYAKGKSYNSLKRPDLATEYLTKAVKLQPNQALYHAELAISYATLQNENLGVAEISKATDLSPLNVNLKRIEYSVFMTLLPINSSYLADARNTLIKAVEIAPTDAKLRYYLGLTYARNGQIDLSLQTLQKAIDLKSNYKEARDAYAIILQAGSDSK